MCCLWKPAESRDAGEQVHARHTCTCQALQAAHAGGCWHNKSAQPKQLPARHIMQPHMLQKQPSVPACRPSLTCFVRHLGKNTQPVNGTLAAAHARSSTCIHRIIAVS